jgi:hypothetical protein
MSSRPDAKLNILVCLDDEVRAFIAGIADQKHSDMGRVVNDLLHSDMNLGKAVQQPNHCWRFEFSSSRHVVTPASLVRLVERGRLPWR